MTTMKWIFFAEKEGKKRNGKKIKKSTRTVNRPPSTLMFKGQKPYYLDNVVFRFFLLP